MIPIELRCGGLTAAEENRLLDEMWEREREERIEHDRYCQGMQDAYESMQYEIYCRKALIEYCKDQIKNVTDIISAIKGIPVLSKNHTENLNALLKDLENEILVAENELKELEGEVKE